MSANALKVTVPVTTTQEVKVMTPDELLTFATKIARSLSTGFVDLWKLGQHMVFLAYGRSSEAEQQQVGDTLSNIINTFVGAPTAQAALYNYMKRAGINASKPVAGSRSYIIGGVLDRGMQEKAFDYVRRVPPIAIEQKPVQARGVRPLQGTAVERARTKASAAIKQMHKTDPDGAAALNEMLQQHDTCIFDEHGTKILISLDELDDFAMMRTLHVDGEWLGFRTPEDVANKLEFNRLKQEYENLKQELAALTEDDGEVQLPVVHAVQ